MIRSTRSIERLLGAVIAATLMAGCALAQDTASTSSPAFKLDSGDIAWMLTSSALVLMMTGPGLALFYSGLVRRKNVLGTMMQSFAMMVLMALATTLATTPLLHCLWRWTARAESAR